MTTWPYVNDRSWVVTPTTQPIQTYSVYVECCVLTLLLNEYVSGRSSASSDQLRLSNVNVSSAAIPILGVASTCPPVGAALPLRSPRRSLHSNTANIFRTVSPAGSPVDSSHRLQGALHGDGCTHCVFVLRHSWPHMYARGKPFELELIPPPGSSMIN